jgi:homoserine O-succinyltransferase
MVQPKLSIFNKKGAMIISVEKIRSTKDYERAIMGVRFLNEFVGLQFHPEADSMSFIANLKNIKKREKIIEMKGKTKFEICFKIYWMKIKSIKQTKQLFQTSFALPLMI